LGTHNFLKLAHDAALVGQKIQHFILINRIYSEVIGQSFWEFGRAPCSAKKSIHGGSRHGASVIQRKKVDRSGFSLVRLIRQSNPALLSMQYAELSESVSLYRPGNADFDQI